MLFISTKNRVRQDDYPVYTVIYMPPLLSIQFFLLNQLNQPLKIVGRYCLSKKTLPNLCSNLLYKMGNYFFYRRYCAQYKDSNLHQLLQHTRPQINEGYILIKLWFRYQMVSCFGLRTIKPKSPRPKPLCRGHQKIKFSIILFNFSYDQLEDLRRIYLHRILTIDINILILSLETLFSLFSGHAH